MSRPDSAADGTSSDERSAREQSDSSAQQPFLDHRTIHDLNGPLVTASGFIDELGYVQEELLGLLETLPATIDETLLDRLKLLLEVEYVHCHRRVQESLQQLVCKLDTLTPPRD